MVDGVSPVAYAAKSSPAILNSWKEIAGYLDRGVRTVQRWERELRLPVHRVGRGKRSPVYALEPELRFWLVTSGVSIEDERRAKFEPQQPKVHSTNAKQPDPNCSQLRLSHELIEKSRELVRTFAAATVRQQRQTEILQMRILEIRSRMR